MNLYSWCWTVVWVLFGPWCSTGPVVCLGQTTRAVMSPYYWAEKRLLMGFFALDWAQRTRMWADPVFDRAHFPRILSHNRVAHNPCGRTLTCMPPRNFSCPQQIWKFSCPQQILILHRTFFWVVIGPWCSIGSVCLFGPGYKGADEFFVMGR